MDHHSMILVLAYLAESGPAKSGKVAESLGLKPKHASMVLSRCADRGFVSRRPYKSGKVRGYDYELSHEGAQWLLYKASQKTNDARHSTEPMKEVGNKCIHPPSFKMLGLKKKHPSKDFMPIQAGLSMLAISTANVYARTYQSLKRQYDSLGQQFHLAMVLLRMRSSERDFIYYLYLADREKLKLLEETKHKKTVGSSEHDKASHLHEFFRMGLDQGIEIGLKLGIQIGKFNQIVRTQASLNRILKKRSRSF